MSYISLALTLCIACTQVPVAKRVSDRERDGFAGPVKRVFVEWSPVYRPRGNIPPGARCRQMTNVYDASGRLTQHSVYPGTCGNDEMREEYTYDRDGDRTTRTLKIRGKDSPPPPAPVMLPDSVGEKGPPRRVFKYDSSGRLAEEALTMPSGRVVYRITYRYDTKGRMIETASGDGGSGVTRRAYTYKGDEPAPSGFTYVGSDGKVYERTAYSEYEFNSRGDWIKRKETTEETLDRRSVSLTFREIEYYPSEK